MIALEPAPVEYSLRRAGYDVLVGELEAAGFRARLVNRRAYRNTGATTVGPFIDLVIRLGRDALSLSDVDDLIERVQQALSTDSLPAEPRMGKILVDDGMEYVFPLDAADIP